MSSYTESNKRTLSTWLDNAGLLLDIPRLSEETLFNYKQRLIDAVRNRGNSTIRGLNYSLSRQAGLPRTHILTLEPLNNSDPFIEITSKYLRLKDGDTVDLEIDLYSNTIGNIQLLISASSTKYEVTYYDEDYANFSAKKLFYGDNLRSQVEYLQDSELTILKNSYLKDISFSSSKHKYSKSTLDEVQDIYDYFIDYDNGLVYTGQNGIGFVSYSYYEIPFKIFYTPVSFFPLNDKDINEIIMDSVLTDNGNEHNILNSKGADYINELLSVAPIHWGD